MEVARAGRHLPRVALLPHLSWPREDPSASADGPIAARVVGLVKATRTPFVNSIDGTLAGPLEGGRLRVLAIASS
jgi:hypothetical protein